MRKKLCFLTLYSVVLWYHEENKHLMDLLVKHLKNKRDSQQHTTEKYNLSDLGKSPHLWLLLDEWLK